MEEEAQDAAAEARAKAEARRKRILEASGTRMGIVSGEQEKTAEEGESPKPKSTRHSRLQEMRRRRFKKAQKESTSEESVSEKATDKAAPIEPEMKPTSESEPVSTARSTEPQPVTKPAEEKATENEEPKEEPKSTSANRKYKGVAKMRRQRLKEKQKAESEKNVTTQPVVVKAPPKAGLNKGPIILYILTVVILFLVGFDIGSNQLVNPDTVRRALSTDEHGIGLLNRIRAPSADPKALLEAQNEWSGGDDADEFEDVNEKREKNIDPLFQVDLDDFTRGDGLFFMAARAAVAIHRMNLLLLYYTPIAIFTAVVHIPQKLLSTPPIIFLVCFGVRQIAKRLLGAVLPEPVVETDKQDILAIIKNSVMGFLTNTFPTAVELYDAFSHARTDMLVVLCGIFFGLLLSNDDMFDPTVVYMSGIKASVHSSGLNGQGSDEL